jgi:hypothetical protein
MLEDTAVNEEELMMALDMYEQRNNAIYKSPQFLEFEEDCCRAFNILRKEGNKLINLFLLMLSAGMPELNHEKDL